jgi:hypothetical protein
MSSNRWKYCLAAVVVSAVLLACGVVLATFLLARLFADPDTSWPKLRVPPVEQWPAIELSIDPALHCPTPVICRGSSHLGPRHVAPYEPCCNWRFEVTEDAEGERRIHMASGADDEYGDEQGEAFDFVLYSSPDPRARVFARAYEYRGEKRLQGLFGTVTLNTLEWREHEPVHVHFEFGYYYDDDPTNWSTIEVCADAPVTLER